MSRRFLLSLTIVLATQAPALAQYSAYTNVPGHQPVWQASRLGGYYDATGVIKGTVAARDLHLYGGRMDDGTPVNGDAKVRNGDGQLLDANQYWYYRQMLNNRLTQLTNYRSSLLSQGVSRKGIEIRNIDAETDSIRGELSQVDGRYGSMYTTPISDFASMPSLPNDLLSRFGLTELAANPAVNPYDGSYRSPYMGSDVYSPTAASDYKSTIIRQGLGLLKSKFGF